jgi:hypothetical protein
MSYLEKRGQHSTGWWCGAYKHETAGQFRARFKTKDQADAYEAHIRAFGLEPDWAHTADVGELASSVEKLSEDLRAAEERQRASEERCRKLEDELAATRRDIVTLMRPEVTALDDELKERQALRNTFTATVDNSEGSDETAQPKADEETEQLLYQIYPSSLYSLNHGRRYTPRSPDKLAAAEQLLSDLNFQKDVSDNIVTHTFYHDHYTVLADPRRKGGIWFCVFNEGQVRRTRAFRTEVFFVSDYDVSDIRRTFRWRLSRACMALAKRDKAARK